jgi:hypothetical protein
MEQKVNQEVAVTLDFSPSDRVRFEALAPTDHAVVNGSDLTAILKE